MSSVPEQRSIPESFVLMLYDYLGARGIDPEALLAHKRPVVLAHEQEEVSLAAWKRMLEKAAAHLHDPQLGLKLGQTIAPRHAGVVGYLLLASATLEEALQRLGRYQILIHNIRPMEVSRRGVQVDFTWPTPPRERVSPLVDETSLAALVRFCRQLCDTMLHPVRVSFVHATPADVRPYLEFFRCPVLFDQSLAGVSFDAKTLALPVRSADPAALALMQQKADQLLASLPAEAPLVTEVRRHIGRMLQDGAPDVERVAQAMHCSPRTLQRRLHECGSNFRDELAKVRHRLALAYLRDTRLGLADVAMLLGYTEHSAFTRSFARWTGQAPVDWRRARVSGAGGPK